MAVEVGRGLVQGGARDLTRRIADLRRPLPYRAGRIHRDRATGLLRPYRGASLDAVDPGAAGGLERDAVAVGHVVHIAHVQVAARTHVNRTVGSRNAVNHQTGGLSDGDAASARHVHCQRVHQGIELHGTRGAHVQVVGDEDRGAVGGDGLRRQTQAARDVVGGDDAAAHGQDAFDVQRDIPRLIEALQPTDKTGQREVGDRGIGAAAQRHKDVALGAKLEVLGRQDINLNVDEAGVHWRTGLQHGVQDVAVSVVVDTEGRFDHDVGLVAITVVVHIGQRL